MSNYTQTTDFSAKDNLASGNANKVIKGSDFDTEFSAIATAIATKVESGDIPSGSVMFFFQEAAHTVFTKSTANIDKSLRVTSGDGGATGGTVAFETAFASQTATIGGTALTVAQLPAHNHPIPDPMGINSSVPQGVNFGDISGGSATVPISTATNRTTSNTGSGSTHTHTSSAIDLDVEYLNVIVCTKD